MKINNLPVALLEDDSGGTAIEYGLIVSLIVIALIGALTSTADSTLAMWNHVETQMDESTS